MNTCIYIAPDKQKSSEAIAIVFSHRHCRLYRVVQKVITMF